MRGFFGKCEVCRYAGSGRAVKVLKERAERNDGSMEKRLRIGSKAPKAEPHQPLDCRCNPAFKRQTLLCWRLGSSSATPLCRFAKFTVSLQRVALTLAMKRQKARSSSKITFTYIRIHSHAFTIPWQMLRYPPW